jgi:RNA polymerase sigma-70 factor (ECF subfamily)
MLQDDSSLTRCSDEDLVSLAQAGDTQSFERLVDRHKEKSIRLAFMMLKDYEDAKDVAQESFIKVYGALSNFKGDSKFTTWLYRVVANRCKDFMKKRKLPTTHDETIFETLPDERIQPMGEKIKMKAVLDGALDALGFQQRSVVILRYFQDLSVEETASVLNIKEGTVKATCHQALKLLKGILSESARI